MNAVVKGSAASKTLPLGKLPVDLLDNLIKATSMRDARVLLGPGIGIDCAVIEIGDRALALKSDPITFTSDEIGWYAVQVNANDIATTGATPRWMLVTLLMPEGQTTERSVKRIQEQLDVACKEIGVSIIGGHTEITYGLDRPIVVGTMIGEVDRAKLITPQGLKSGDKLLLTKGVPIEATAIIASEFTRELQSLGPDINQNDIDAGRKYLHHPGISVLRDAQIAIKSGAVHAMHDPTEGGLYAAAWELARACGRSLWVDPKRVPVPPLAKLFCAAMQVDPLGAIASGALLLATPESDVQAIRSSLETEGIPCAEIGGVLEESVLPEVRMGTDPGAPRLPLFARDEIARLYETR